MHGQTVVGFGKYSTAPKNPPTYTPNAYSTYGFVVFFDGDSFTADRLVTATANTVDAYATKNSSKPPLR